MLFSSRNFLSSMNLYCSDLLLARIENLALRASIVGSHTWSISLNNSDIWSIFASSGSSLNVLSDNKLAKGDCIDQLSTSLSWIRRIIHRVFKNTDLATQSLLKSILFTSGMSVCSQSTVFFSYFRVMFSKSGFTLLSSVYVCAISIAVSLSVTDIIFPYFFMIYSLASSFSCGIRSFHFHLSKSLVSFLYSLFASMLLRSLAAPGRFLLHSWSAIASSVPIYL